MSKVVKQFICASVILLIMAALISAPTLKASDCPPRHILEGAPEILARQFADKHEIQSRWEKPPGLLTPEQWASLIDEVWGPGLYYNEHMTIWYNFWNNINDDFAGFEGLETGLWTDVWNLYRPEIIDTVSRGRLCAMVNHACRRLSDPHTWADDNYVSQSVLQPGMPLMVNSGHGNNDHFGAGLTVLPDSNLLVYKVGQNHPLNLVPGDLILGYHGIPWSQLYKDLIEAELPVTGGWWGGHDVSYSHSLHTAAGLNWHLYDTIDVVRYETDDTVHLPTDLMLGYIPSCWATEQMPVEGVPMPDIYQGELTTWGVITGTNIGYIYSLGWLPASDSAEIVNYWMNALDELQYNYNVSGVIMDFRTNFGTNFSFQKVINRIFDYSEHFLQVDNRCGGHLDYCRFPYFEYFFDINGTADAEHWDRSIAILTGPGAVSGGDFYPMVLSRHPNAKVFGKPTSGAFGGMDYPTLYTGWFQEVGNTNSYLVDNPGQHLVHAKFPRGDEFPWVDYENIWLTQEGVAEGRDDVVEAAVAWIISRDVDEDGVLNEGDNCLHAYNPEQTDDDGDSIGDACDNCPSIFNPSQEDLNGNDVGDACDYMCGDPDGDEQINIIDIVYLINYKYKNGPAPNFEEAADVNSDEEVNILDIVYLINFIYKNGPGPNCS